jgi:hypothetical protein
MPKSKIKPNKYRYQKKTKMKKIIVLFLLISSFAFAQEKPIKGSRGGLFSLGVRNTMSMFNDGSWSNNGVGFGGQFRIQLSEFINTEWFLDYISGNVGNFANRNDTHIGWSVMLYPFKSTEKLKIIQPYVLAGHCFDYTYIKENNNANNFGERWSSAVQGGLGTHINLSQRIDISFAAQYMIHLGNDLHAHKNDFNNVIIHNQKGVNLEGHVLMNLSVNYKLVDLWEK